MSAKTLLVVYDKKELSEKCGDVEILCEFLKMFDKKMDVLLLSAQELTERVDVTFWKAVIFLHRTANVEKAVSDIKKSFDPEHGGKIKVVLEADRPTEDYVVTSSFEELSLWYPFVLQYLFNKPRKDPTKAPTPCLFVFDGNKFEQDQVEYKCFLDAKKALEQLGIPCLWPGDDIFATQVGPLALLDLQPSVMFIFARNGAQNMLTKNTSFINIFAQFKSGQKALIFYDEKSKSVFETFDNLQMQKLMFEVECDMVLGYLKWATLMRELKIIESEDVGFGEARTVNKIAIAVACIICLPFSIILVVLACACLCFGIDLGAVMEKTCCKPKPNQVQPMDG